MDTGMTGQPWGSQATEPAKGTELEMSWLSPIGMIGLSITNFVFRILTLGIYDFWARTEVRKRLWSAVRIDGEPLVYTGSGKELFLGFLIVFGVILLPMLIVTTVLLIALGPNSAAAGLLQFALYVVIIFLFGIAIYRAQRYRLLRTTWRGIRGSMEGSSTTYGWTYFWTMVLIPITLGWIIPWRSTKLQSLITNDARFGDRPFSFKGDAGPLYGPFALLWFGVLVLSFVTFAIIGTSVGVLQQSLGPGALTPDGELKPEFGQVVALVTLAILAVGYLLYLLLSAWYRSRTINHFAQCTHFENANFKSNVTGSGLLWIDLTNLLIQIFGMLIVVVPLTAILALALGPSIPATEASYNAGLALTQLFAPIFLLIVALSFTLLLPVTQARSMGYLINHLDLEGTVPVDQISQSTADNVSVGEGLAQAFDVDAF